MESSLDNPRLVPDKYKKLQKGWKRYELLWSFLHYSIGISATIFAFLASSKDITELFTNYQISTIFSLLAGILTVALTFLSPASRRKAYTESCDLLRVTRLRDESESLISSKDLNDAIEKSQNIISIR